MNRKQFLEISKGAFHKWQTNNATLRAAALAFFTILPLPSLLLIITALLALVYGEPQALQRLTEQISVVAGPTVAGIVWGLLESAQNPFTSILGSVVSVAFAAAGAIGAFSVLQDTLNAIWEVTPRRKLSLKLRVRHRVVPFLLVAGTGVIVAAWTVISALLFSSISFILEPLIGNSASIILGAVQVLLSFALATLFSAFLYNQIPDAHVEWRDVGLAAVITGAVFTALNYLFGIYIRAFPVTSVVGAAGSLMVLLLWIFVTDLFVLFGAQFSKVYAEKVGSRAKEKKAPTTKRND